MSISYQRMVRQEVLDLTIGIIGIQKLIHNWRLSDEPSLSDPPQVLQKEHRNLRDIN